MRASSEARLTREIALFCLAALPRIIYLLAFAPPVESAYWALAGNIVKAGSLALAGVKTTDFEPLYPVFLAAARFVARDRALVVQLLQIAVSSIGAVFLYRFALTLSGNARAAMTSGALFAFHPLLVRQAAAASDLALVTTLLVVFAYAFVSIRNAAGAAIAGACLGLAVLTRSMVLPVLVCGLAILIWESRHAAAAAFVLAALLLVTPFAIRNHSLSGSWLPTRSGMNLYIGNSPYTDALLPDYDLDLLQDSAHALFARERQEVSDAAPEYAAALDRFLTKRALSHMRERPLRTLERKLLNVVYFFSPRLVPYQIATADTRVVIGPDGQITVQNSASRPRVEVFAHALASSSILLTALAGVWLRRHDLRRDAILWAIAATFVGVNALYVPATRYSAPMQFVLLFYSGVALARVVQARVNPERARGVARGRSTS